MSLSKTRVTYAAAAALLTSPLIGSAALAAAPLADGAVVRVASNLTVAAGRMPRRGSRLTLPV